MSKSSVFLPRVVLSTLLLVVASHTASYAVEGGSLSKEASFTLEQARAAAINEQPGKIVDQELERKKGGSGLRYSFDIKVGKVTHEVGIDAKTGAVLQNSVEK
jgi:uncharacterized membrane protein YkoI